MVDAVVANLPQKPKARHNAATVVGKAIGRVQLFHMANKAMDEALFTAAVGNAEAAQCAEQGCTIYTPYTYIAYVVSYMIAIILLITARRARQAVYYCSSTRLAQAAERVIMY